MRALILALLLAACAAPPPSKDGPVVRPLTGTRWALVQEANIRAPTIEFREEERASGFAGCNQWFAQVARPDGGLTFSAIGMTRRACEPAMMDIERDFADRLERTRAVQVDDDTLTLLGENGDALARFERAR